MPYGSDAWGSDPWSAGETVSTDYTLIAVGQDTANNCLVAMFNGTTWAVFPFPAIVGILRGVYAYNDQNIWVCGGTGVLGTTSALLYFWNGTSWIDYSASTNAKYFYSIDGYGLTNVWASGLVDAVTAGVWHYTSYWTPTQVNTGHDLGYPNAGAQVPLIAVASDGIAYTSCWTTISSNRVDPAWASYYAAVGSQTVSSHAVASGAVLFCYNAGTGPILKYDGAVTWTVQGTNTHSSISMGAKDWTNYCYYNLGDGIVYAYNNAVTTALTGAADFSDSNKYIYFENTIWTAGPTLFGGTWAAVPQLSLYIGGTTWSDSTEYNVGGLGAAAWYDIAPVTIYIPNVGNYVSTAASIYKPYRPG